MTVVGDITISADGYSAGLNQTEERPFGDDGGTTIIGMLPGKQSLVVSMSGFLSNPAITFAQLDPATGTLSQGVDYTSKDSANKFTTPRIVSADPPVALVYRGSGAVYIVMDDKFNKVGSVEAGSLGDPASTQPTPARPTAAS
ncbi:hypothetical protein ACFQ1S_35515 [Kibdelosporangium lantanae]|uniref:Uncharacterized protein n=1 Tax=Kibdelosporangium lantanae TaxID=1497396 RepID=A0ABW3MIR1_9PSEU